MGPLVALFVLSKNPQQGGVHVPFHNFWTNKAKVIEFK
jgi:hypothetical protein